MIEQCNLGLTRTATILKFLIRYPNLLIYMIIVGLIRTQILNHIPYDSIVVHLVGDILFLWMASALLYRTESILLKQPRSIRSALTLPLKNFLYMIIGGTCIGIISLLCLHALASFDSLGAQELVNFILLSITTLILSCLAIIITFEKSSILNTITKTLKIMSWDPVALFTSYGLLTALSFIVMLMIFLVTIFFGSIGILSLGSIMDTSWFNIITLITMTFVIAVFQTSIVLICLSFYHDRRSTEQEVMMVDIRSIWMQ